MEKKTIWLLRLWGLSSIEDITLPWVEPSLWNWLYNSTHVVDTFLASYFLSLVYHVPKAESYALENSFGPDSYKSHWKVKFTEGIFPNDSQI